MDLGLQDRADFPVDFPLLRCKNEMWTIRQMVSWEHREGKAPSARAVHSLGTMILRCASELTRGWKRPQVLQGYMQGAAGEHAEGHLSRAHRRTPVHVLLALTHRNTG